MLETEEMIKRYLEGEDIVPAKSDGDQAMLAFREFKRRKDETLRRKKIIRWTAAISAAACIAIIAGSLFGIRLLKPSGRFTASAPAGEVENVTLPDGTGVWLNSGSSITCSKQFGVKDRQVNLSGEGYFEVTKNEKLPFVVNTGAASVTVLGTKFDFRDYSADSEASLILYEGSVTFARPSGESLDLTPGQSAILDKRSGKISLASDTLTGMPAAWRNGILVFEDCTLERICRELSGAYGTSIRISDPSLMQLRFTAEFDTHGQSLSDVLDALSLTRHISFRITEAGAEVF